MVDDICTLCDLFHTYRKGFGTPLYPLLTILVMLHLIFHSESVTKKQDLAGKFGQLLARITHDMIKLI